MVVSHFIQFESSEASASAVTAVLPITAIQEQLSSDMLLPVCPPAHSVVAAAPHGDASIAADFDAE